MMMKDDNYDGEDEEVKQCCQIRKLISDGFQGAFGYNNLF